ncbi:MAG: Tm-1-like ATP-binding domain-containing protein, partial [Promethearchaeota archaeon]
MSKKIAIIGTLDTKAEEMKYLKEQIMARGHEAVVIDVGVIGPILFEPDIKREQIAKANNTTIEKITAYNNEAKAMNQMAIGATKIIKELNYRGDLDGVLAIGGTMGTDLALDVMNALPIGLP